MTTPTTDDAWLDEVLEIPRGKIARSLNYVEVTKKEYQKTAIRKRLLEAEVNRLNAVLDDKPPTTIDLTLNYWNNRIKRQKAELQAQIKELEKK